MLTPKVVGLETEYGITLRRQPASLSATRAFFRNAVPSPIPWDYATESPTKDARGVFPLENEHTSSSPTDPEDEEFAKLLTNPADAAPRPLPQTFSLTFERELSTILPNGARFYIDHAHPEYCTPECLHAHELVAADKAGEYLLMEMVQHANRAATPDQQVILYKNNSDHQGHSYGCHENYLMAAPIYEALFNNQAHWLYAYLIPFLVSRQILCGAGKVGVEQGTGWADYQLSQRADFFERVIGLQTTHTRPLINTRDEAHANGARFRRLHVICGDANLAEWATYLKVAVTQLVLTMLEAKAFSGIDNLLLADPVLAFQTISRDPTLKSTVPLEHGSRYYSAIHLQRVFVEAAQRYLAEDAAARATWQAVWNDWAQTVEWLETAPEKLDSRLDWRIKWNFLRTQLQRKQIDWRHPLAREMDMKYHQLDLENGFFYLLQKMGQVERWLPVDQLERARQQPPVSTRAYLRGLCVQKYPTQLVSANWNTLTFREAGDASPTLRLRMPDPTDCTQARIAALLKAEARVEDLIDRIGA